MRCPTASLCFLAVFLALGCAVTRVQAPPAEAPEAKRAEGALEALEDSTTQATEPSPSADVYRLLHESFTQLRSEYGEGAVAPLDSASILLSDLLSTSDQVLSPERLTGLIRVSLELYGILLPKTAPIAADSPLSGLLDALPNGPVASVQTHPHYQRFRILRLAGAADRYMRDNPINQEERGR